jgi:hypothetical protein
MPTQPAPSTFKLVKTKLRRMLGITKKKAA